MSMTTLDLRGRDLITIPPDDLASLPTAELLDTLFGSHLPKAVRNSMVRDKRSHFLRTQPIPHHSLFHHYPTRECVDVRDQQPRFLFSSLLWPLRPATEMYNVSVDRPGLKHLSPI